jgi:hypothetical protein
VRRDPRKLFSKLLSRARRGAVEVEDLLAFIPAEGARVVPSLRALAMERGWSRDEGAAGMQPPLASWVDAVACALERGPAGLRDSASDAGRADHERRIFLSALERFHTAAGAAAVMDVLAQLRPPPQDEDLRQEGFGVLNLILSFAPPVVLEPAVEKRCREMVEQRIRSATTLGAQATALCALRGVGDASSLELVLRTEQLPAPWQGVKASAIRAIRRRIRKRS